MYDYIVAVILGIVEGLTEFIPVSSTGHMIIVGHMLDFVGSKASTFEVFIQLGAILAVFVVYKERFLVMAKPENWRRKDGLSVVHIIIGMIPAMGIGFLGHSFIKNYLFGQGTVIIGLIIGALFMMFAEMKRSKVTAKTVDEITYRQALQIGLFQVLSLWPGFSRSGSTIAGGMLVGVSRKAGADFTFIMALPIMAIACTYDFLKIYKDLNSSDLLMFAIGFVVAFGVAYASIIWFLKFLGKYNLFAFALYRIFFAVLSFIYFYIIL